MRIALLALAGFVLTLCLLIWQGRWDVRQETVAGVLQRVHASMPLQLRPGAVRGSPEAAAGRAAGQVGPVPATAPGLPAEETGSDVPADQPEVPASMTFAYATRGGGRTAILRNLGTETLSVTVTTFDERATAVSQLQVGLGPHGRQDLRALGFEAAGAYVTLSSPPFRERQFPIPQSPESSESPDS